MINFIHGVMFGFSFFVLFIEIYGYRRRIQKLEEDYKSIQNQLNKSRINCVFTRINDDISK